MNTEFSTAPATMSAVPSPEMSPAATVTPFRLAGSNAKKSARSFPSAPPNTLTCGPPPDPAPVTMSASPSPSMSADATNTPPRKSAA